MKLSNHSAVPVYTISGSNTARPLPEWLARKRKRSLKNDPEYANRVELLQDFEFEEASQCIRISEDGQWVMSTGTYKPQMHVHNLPQLSLSFARHTDTLNHSFQFLSTDYTKSIHLQTDRSVEFHTPLGCHYTARLPRYGRDLKYEKRSTEALVPSSGVNADGNGEVFRLNLELGRFMRGYEVDVGGDDMTSAGGGALQGGINTGSVNVAAIAEDSHNLLAFGTSLGTVEFWDPRSRSRVGIVGAPNDHSIIDDGRAQITALEFHTSGLTLASGSSQGLVYLYDLRSPVPLLKKDQGYGYPIQNINFLTPTTSTARQTSEPKILTADKRIIKIWDARSGDPWTSVEPAVDLHDVAWCRDSGMLLTANEGRQQHAFFIPQLGPAPKWCSFLDSLVEEMAETADDPNAYTHSGVHAGAAAGDVYDNFKFLTLPQLRALNLDHLIGTTNLLRPYMHGYFVNQRLYEEARLIAQPDAWAEQRARSVQEKIDRERESRIRGTKKVAVRVNRRLAERAAALDEKAARRRARKILQQGGDEAAPAVDNEEVRAAGEDENPEPPAQGLLHDPRFAQLFEDEDFAIDETSREFQALNPSTKVDTSTTADEPSRRPRGLTAVEEEALEEPHGSSSDSDFENENTTHPSRAQQDPSSTRISSSSYKKSGHRPQRPPPAMHVSSTSAAGAPQRQRDRSFGARFSASAGREGKRRFGSGGAAGKEVVGEKEITFAPERRKKADAAGRDAGAGVERVQKRRDQGRRSASGNTMRRL